MGCFLNKMAKPREKFKTYGNVFDNFTNRVLFKLISQGHFEEDSLSPVFIGKESNVFRAKTKEGNYIIVKIYRLETCDFNRLYEYIRLDTRFEKLPRRRRMIIFAWSQREYRNLMKAREIIRVPMPITFSYNVLLLEMIGDNGVPSPQLKDVHLENPKIVFDKIIDNIENLHKAGFVHGDLSEFNILYWRDEPIFIDFSQCQPIDSNRADEFLLRDIKNICRFFKKWKIESDYHTIYEQIKLRNKKT